MYAIKLSQYHSIVLIIYGVLTPFLVYIFPHAANLQYQFENGTTVVFLVVTPLVILVFFFQFWRKRTFWVPTRYALIQWIVYGLIFAFPEEIIFRGILQNYLEQYSTLGSIVLVSVIFGLAHVLNGAVGYQPSQWNWRIVGLATLGGIPLGTLFAFTHSILPSLVLHTLFLVILFGFDREKQNDEVLQ